MFDTGFKTPTTTPTPGANNNWTSPANAYIEDGSFATWNLSGSTEQDYGTFGFNVPLGATIVGIEAKVKGKATSADYINIYLKGSTTAGKNISLTTINTQYTVGGSTDLWGVTWTPADFADSSFKLTLGVGPLGGGGITGYPFSVDGIQIKVYYTFASSLLIDSYSESNGSIWYATNSVDGIVGQSFTAIASSLTQAKFYLRRGGGTPTGSIYAKLYAHSGTFGSTGVPTGAALATSDPIDSATIGSESLFTFTFSGANRYTLVGGTKYFIVLDALASGNGTNYISIRSDNTAPTHSGNMASNTGAWAAASSDDLAFYVLGVQLPLVNTNTYNNVTSTTATANGTIDVIGGSAVTHRGIVYNQFSVGSTPGNVAPTSSGYSLYADDTGSFSPGSFSKLLTSLAPAQTYYYRAYASNSNGYAYGEETHFTTSDSITAVFTGIDPGNVVKALLNVSQAQGGNVYYDSGSVDLAGYTVNYTFKLNTVLEGIKKMRDLAPSDFYWYIDPATNKLYFKEQPTTANHVLVLGKHIANLDLEYTIENIKNIVYITGGDIGAGVSLLAKYTNEDSLSNHRIGLERLNDNRVTQSESAELLSEDVLNSNSTGVYRTTVTILEDTYDIESFNLGQMVNFKGFGNFIDNLLLQIVGVERSPDQITLSLGTTAPRATRTVEALKRQLNSVLTVNNPDVPA